MRMIEEEGSGVVVALHAAAPGSLSRSIDLRAGKAVEAGDAVSASRLIEAGGVDVLLLDVRMPGESGIDFCRRLRSTPAGAALPIMFVTADVNDQRIVEATEAGADDYLTKPFHRAELALRLDNLLLRAGGSSTSSAMAAMVAARRALVRPEAAEDQKQQLRIA